MSSLIELLNKKVSLENSKEFFKIKDLDIRFYRVTEVTFDDKAPRREALENVFGSLKLEGVNIVYLILGNQKGISFYFGVVKTQKDLPIDVDDVAREILKPNIEGNFRGSKVEQVKKDEKRKIIASIEEFSYISEVSGIPEVNEEAKNFQGIDRLVDVMLKDEFALMVLAKSLDIEEIEEIEKEIYTIYDKISPLVKKSIQKTESKSSSNNEANTDAETTSKSKSNSISKTISESDSKSTNDTNTTSTSTNETNQKSSKISETGGKSKSVSETTSKSTNSSASNSNTESESKNSNNTKSKSLNYSENKSESINTNMEFTRKEYEEWLKYIDEILLKRVDYAKGRGGFKSGIYLFTNTKGKMTKLANSFVSLFGGIKENRTPLKYNYISIESKKQAIYNFQIPNYKFDFDKNEKQKLILESKLNGISWLSTQELSLIASLPQKEVVGLRLKEEVEFGLNISSKEGLNIGKLVRSGQKLDIDVNLEIEDLNKHIFITGVTGSGKTTTCHKVLYESKLPFLVIEPAKTEYRILAQNDDVLVFTLGNENIAPFRLNPFEFYEGENISARVDMIKAAIESSFDMEAAIPQLIEATIYRVYEHYGWDIETSTNDNFDNPFEKGVKSFPMLKDVLKFVDEVVEEQNFDDRLKKDYIGSIKARLQALTIGSKNFMLNCERSFNFNELLHKKVVIELEEIKSPSEKSFIMGMILINLNEALKREHKKDKNFKHITLIEEAHRLLSRYEAGDSLNKKNGIESFTDMLAEVRKYGESLIIVDQIANKLTPEVLKNTNTKIVHRIFASDDKDAIGNTMALDKEQKEFLSKLEIGKAIMFNQNFYNSIQVKVEPLENISTTESDEIDVSTLRKKWLEFYQFENNLNYPVEDLEDIFKLERAWKNLIKNRKSSDKTNFEKNFNIISKMLNKFELEFVKELITKRFYSTNPNQLDLDMILEKIKNNEELSELLKSYL